MSVDKCLINVIFDFLYLVFQLLCDRLGVAKQNLFEILFVQPGYVSCMYLHLILKITHLDMKVELSKLPLKIFEFFAPRFIAK